MECELSLKGFDSGLQSLYVGVVIKGGPLAEGPDSTITTECVLFVFFVRVVGVGIGVGGVHRKFCSGWD
jgi:hypothetical protein